MERKTLTTILSFALSGSFFMPFFNWHSFEMNGFNFILSDHIASYKYLLLTIPFSSLFLLLGAMNEENYFFSRKLLSWMPLFTLVVIFLLVYVNLNYDRSFFDDGNIFSNTGTGFWFALSLSLLLVFVKDNPKTQYRYQKTEL